MEASVSASYKPLEVQILKDLAGKVIKDPSPDSYFSEDWTWTLKQEDISYLTFIHESIERNLYYVSLMTIHLLRHNMPVDVKVILTYKYESGQWNYYEMRVQSITFPPQKNYAANVKMYMDYDFLPALVVKNNSSQFLFVAGYWMQNGEMTRFAVELEPRQKKTIAYGPAPDDYGVHFAYAE